MTKNKINSLITIVVIAIIGIGLFISCKDDNSFSEERIYPLKAIQQIIKTHLK